MLEALVNKAKVVAETVVAQLILEVQRRQLQMAAEVLEVQQIVLLVVLKDLTV